MSVGVHVSKSSLILEKTNYKTFIEAIKTEVELLNLSALSIFIVGPLSKHKVKLNTAAIKSYCDDNKIAVWPHCSYIVVGIWSVTKENQSDPKSVMWLNHLKDHLTVGKQINAKGVVIHVPRHTIQTLVETMEVISNSHIMKDIKNVEGLPALTLETPASKPSDTLTYETPEKLNALIRTLVNNKNISVNFNVCIDTCHEYAGGVSFSQQGSWRNWDMKLSNETRSRIKLIHLNGASGKNFGTGKDGHIIPMAQDDAIWGHLVSGEFRDYLARTPREIINKVNLYDQLSTDEKNIIISSALNEIIQWCKIYTVSIILEVKRGKYADVKFAVDVINSLSK